MRDMYVCVCAWRGVCYVCVRHFVRPLATMWMLPERSLGDFSFDLKSTKATLAFRPADIP